MNLSKNNPNRKNKQNGNRVLSSPFFQAKLTVNKPNDAYEQEADAIAERVMRMQDTKKDALFFQPKPIGVTPVQRKCSACGQEEKLQRKEEDEEEIIQQKKINGPAVQRKCAHCEEEEKGSLQMKGQPSSAGGMIAPSIVHNVINSPGQPMDKNARSFMESRFGFDFGDVRIHNDSLADESSSDINALAYTHGNHIVFRSGQYEPGTNSGKQLLAHELTHVLQQADGINKKPLHQSVKAVDTNTIQLTPSADVSDPLCKSLPEEKSDADAEKLQKTPFWDLNYVNSIPPSGEVPIEDPSPLFKDPLGSCNFSAKPPDKDAPQDLPKEATEEIKPITKLPPIPKLRLPGGNKQKTQPLKKTGHTDELLKPEVQSESNNLKALSKIILNRYKSKGPPAIKSNTQQKENKTRDNVVAELSNSVSEFVLQGANLQQFIMQQSLKEKANVRGFITGEYEETRSYFDQLITNTKSLRGTLKRRVDSLYENAYSKIATELFTTRDRFNAIASEASDGLFDDWGASKDELFASYDFATHHMKTIGENAGQKAANRASIWRNYYEFAIGWSDAVRAKVHGEAYDSFFTGKLHTQRTFFAMRDAAVKVGEQYQSGMTNQGEVNADQIDCRRWSKLDAINEGYRQVSDSMTLQKNNGSTLLSNSATLNGHAALTLKEQSMQLIDETWRRTDKQLKRMKDEQLNSLMLAQQKMLANIDMNSIQLQSSITTGVTEAVDILITNLDTVADQINSGIPPSDDELQLIQQLFHVGLDAGVSDLSEIRVSFARGMYESFTGFKMRLTSEIVYNRRNALLLTGKYQEFSEETRSGLQIKFNQIYRHAKTELGSIVTLYEQPLRDLRSVITKKVNNSLVNIKEDLCNTLKKADAETQTMFKPRRMLDKVVVNAAQKAADQQLKAYQRSFGYIKMIVIGFLIGLSIVLTAGLLTPAAIGLLGIGGVVVGLVVIGAVTNALIRITQNLGTDKPLFDGVFKDAVIGGITGLVGAAGGLIFSKAGVVMSFIGNIGLDIGTNIAIDLAYGNQITLGGVLLGAGIGIGVGVAFQKLLSNPAIKSRLPDFGRKAVANKVKPGSLDPASSDRLVAGESITGSQKSSTDASVINNTKTDKPDAAITANKPTAVETPDKTYVIVGEPGKRSVDIGNGHKVVEVPDSAVPTGIGCEIHSSPPFAKVPCPRGMGRKDPTDEHIDAIDEIGDGSTVRIKGELSEESEGDFARIPEHTTVPDRPPRGGLFDKSADEIAEREAAAERGNTFNTESERFYPHNEVYIVSPFYKGRGRKGKYVILDSYVEGKEIVSRKFPTRQSFNPDKAITYINELVDKYPKGAKIANTPKNRKAKLAGKTLQGEYILEVPVLLKDVPQEVLDHAKRAGVTIRDAEGTVY